MEKNKVYRGPPPRKDLVQSPSKERDWKGNDVFCLNETNPTMSDERQRPSSARSDSSSIAYGFDGDEDYNDPHLKATRDYGSSYSKLAMQGGRKDLLAMDGGDDESDNQRKYKGCENISEYNKVARQGGRKDLLCMDGEKELADTSRKQKGCENISDYNRMALQGGHKDLLVIEENKPSAAKVQYSRKGGDWFSHDDPKKSPVKPHEYGAAEQKAVTNSNTNNNHIQEKLAETNPNSARNASASILPGGQDYIPPRVGKKRFDQSAEKRDAPFATFF